MGTHHGTGGAEVSDTPETDEELAELGFGYYTMGGLPADAVKVEFARKLERERDAYEDALRRIYDLSIDGEEIWSDIEQIFAIAHNALNHHE